MSPEGDRFGHTDAELARKGLRRSLALTLTQMYMAPAVVASSDLVATLMRGVIEISGWADRLATFERPFPLEPCAYAMCWHRRNETHPSPQSSERICSVPGDH